MIFLPIPSGMLTSRVLMPTDAEAYAALRVEMLNDSPWAFGSSPGHDRMGSVEAVRSWIQTAEGAIVGGFHGAGDGNQSLIAAAGVMREAAPKRRHIASIWGVYAQPQSRGTGAGRAVVAGAVDFARSWSEVECVQLSVSENSPAARRLYETLGFVAWGHEPDCLRVGGRSYAEIHMALRLR